MRLMARQIKTTVPDQLPLPFASTFAGEPTLVEFDPGWWGNHLAFSPLLALVEQQLPRRAGGEVPARRGVFPQFDEELRRAVGGDRSLGVDRCGAAVGPPLALVGALWQQLATSDEFP